MKIKDRIDKIGTLLKSAVKVEEREQLIGKTLDPQRLNKDIKKKIRD